MNILEKIAEKTQERIIEVLGFGTGEMLTRVWNWRVAHFGLSI